MASPFIGEIRMFGGNYAPAGWSFCNGQLLPISGYETLYNLIGTTYGGNGTTTFGLPNLQGRVPMQQGSGYIIGQMSGEENHTLTVQQIPAHTHAVMGMAAATGNGISGNVYGGGGLSAFKSATGENMNGQVVQNNAGGQPHSNIMPFLAVSFIISLFGIFPSRS
jgi:microcystin-dependent protein